MDTYRGTFTPTVRAESGETAFLLSLDLVVPTSGTARALSVSVTSENPDSPVTEEVLDFVRSNLGHLIDLGASGILTQVATRRLGAGRLTLGTGDDSVVLDIDDDGRAVATLTDGSTETLTITDLTLAPSPDYTEGVYAELQRRRRARLTDDQYEKVAQTYRDAVAQGVPVQQAVAAAMYVSKSRAAALIGQARERGLLPKTTKGKVSR